MHSRGEEDKIPSYFIVAAYFRSNYYYLHYPHLEVTDLLS